MADSYPVYKRVKIRSHNTVHKVPDRQKILITKDPHENDPLTRVATVLKCKIHIANILKFTVKINLYLKQYFHFHFGKI